MLKSGVWCDRSECQRQSCIYFTLLSKLGSSNISEQQDLLSQVMPFFQNYKVCVLGDREFCSVKLAKKLQQWGVKFCLRLKKNEFVEYPSSVTFREGDR